MNKGIFKQNEICYNQTMRLDKFLKVSRLIKRRRKKLPTKVGLKLTEN